MKAIILSIGDELVLGQTVDTNSAWLAQQLAAIGCDIAAHKTVGDDRAAIARMIAEEAPRCDVLLITGGLGPTEDDLTREALSDVLGLPLVENADWIAELERFFKKLGRDMPARNRVQAQIPQGAQMIWNHHGTAPGIRAEFRIEARGVSPGVATSDTASMLARTHGLTPVASSDVHTCTIFVTPGVPKEMKPMFEQAIRPWIAQRSGGAVILQRTLHTFGVGESTVAERLGSLMMRQRNPSVGTTVSGGIVSLRVNARYGSLAEAQTQVTQTVAACYEKLGDLIFGEADTTLAQVVAKLLRESGKTVATAESCTGGLLAKMLTDLPGSSDYFRYGWVVYSNDAKQELLGVEDSTLDVHGAVSEPVVLELAYNARHSAHADYALAISGIAGPTGGSDAKPVGTVCIALAHSSGVTTRTFRFPGDREFIRDRSAKMALSMLRYTLSGKPIPF